MHNDISDKVDSEIRNIKDLWYDTSFTDIRDYNSGWECTHLSKNEYVVVKNFWA